MTAQRLPDLLRHIRQAANDLFAFGAGMSKHTFPADKRTQQAVVLSLVIVGPVFTPVSVRRSA
jgi:uncharacterized protein with HEPN domain